jgi:N-acetylneuraminate synthase
MATLNEIDEALGVLACGYTEQKKAGARAFTAAFESASGRASLRSKVTLLHCTSDYPAPDDEINLRAIDTLVERYGLPVGLSDHSVGISVPIAAVARGAAVIEKHLTLDRTMTGPDHAASIEPREFQAMVAGIRQVERAMGQGGKAPTPSERDTMPVARKSLVASAPIRAGEAFGAHNLAVKRPGTGLAPGRFWDLLDRRASRDYAPDELIAEPIGKSGD